MFQSVSSLSVSTDRQRVNHQNRLHGLAFWFVLPRSSSYITSPLLFPVDSQTLVHAHHRVIQLVLPGRSQMSSIILSHK